MNLTRNLKRILTAALFFASAVTGSLVISDQAWAPRDGSGVMSWPPGTTAVSGHVISSSTYNAFLADLLSDLNGARPIVSGGTGATSASAARTALGIGTLGTQASSAVSITGGSITGITDLALADGGTAASLTDPNADRIMFWDDSAGAVTWLTPSTGLAIITTNLAITAFTGDSGSGGVLGGVPAPAAGDATKFLRGDGTWHYQTAVQWFFSNTSALTDVSTAIPYDDTVPTNSEGVSVYSQAISPKASSGHRIRVSGVVNVGVSSNAIVTVAVYRGTTCVYATSVEVFNNAMQAIPFDYFDNPATTSSTTYSIRVGPATAVTAALNTKDGTNRVFGGTAFSQYSVVEYGG